MSNDRRFQTAVALTLAFIVVMVAVVGTFRRLTVASEQDNRKMVSAFWQAYQNCRVRYTQSRLASDILKEEAPGDVTHQTQNVQREEERSRYLLKRVQELEETAPVEEIRGSRLRTGQILLELALVFASLAIFGRRRTAWIAAIASTLLGMGVAASALL